MLLVGITLGILYYPTLSNYYGRSFIFGCCFVWWLLIFYQKKTTQQDELLKKVVHASCASAFKAFALILIIGWGVQIVHPILQNYTAFDMLMFIQQIVMITYFISYLYYNKHPEKI